MIIRPYTPKDTRAIAQLFRDTVHTINRRDYTPAQLAAWAPEQLDLSAWQRRLQSRHTLVAEKHGQIIGFAELEADGHLDCFYCHCNYQRVGIGSHLLQAVEACAKQQGIKRLYTETSITARPFFARRGFRLLAQQAVDRHGVILTNYRMEKYLD